MRACAGLAPSDPAEVGCFESLMRSTVGGVPVLAVLARLGPRSTAGAGAVLVAEPFVR
jgi:hypothetical protein